MSRADEIYYEISNEIINNGHSDENQNVRTKYADGSPAYTKSIFGVQIEFDGKEVPIVTTKKVAWKTATKEMMLFWIHQTVKKKDFENWNVKVWDEWFLEDDTLGKSYAYQFESRPKKNVVKIKRKIKNKHKDILEDNKISEELKPNFKTNSKYIGEIYETKDYGKYKVIDVFSNGSTRNRKILIQFLNTNYVREIGASQLIHKQNIQDNYHRFYIGIGYLGNVDSIDFYDDELKLMLYRKWYYMLKRCYDVNDREYNNYGGKGIFVDERWHSFENYLKDVRYLPQFFIAKQDNFKGWSIDKDYYGSNFYGMESSVWIKDGENLSYRNTHNPFYLIKPNGEKEIYLTFGDAEKDYGLTNLNKIHRGERNHVRGFTVEMIDISNQDELYRYELSKNQVVELIKNIKQNPCSRRLMTSFWNFSDVGNKALQECAFQTQWNVRNGNLDLLLTQRSADWGLGVCFNQFQYYVLQCIIAQVCDLKVGKFIHQIGSCHIYDRHENVLKEQIKSETFDAPTIWINPNKKDLLDFTPDDVKLINYKHGNKFEMEVAI